MGVVVDFDAFRGFVKFEKFGELALHLRFGPAFSEPAVERFHRVTLSLRHKLAAVPALGD